MHYKCIYTIIRHESQSMQYAYTIQDITQVKAKVNIDKKRTIL